jgi:thiol-disulfide isomerase/thioredoxin
LDSHTEEISVNGKYNKALNYYNENIKSPDYYISTNRIPVLENGTPEEAYQHLDKRRLKNLDFFEGQIKTNQISKDFYNVVSSNINTYYNAYKIFLGGQRRWVTSTKMNEKSFFEKTVKELYPKEVPSSDYDLSSSWTFNLMDFYLKYAFFNEGGDPKNIEDWHSFTLKQAHKYFQGKALEFYIAYYLGMQILTCKDNDKGLIDQVEKFQVKFPESNYSEHLRKSLQPIISYHQKLANIKKNDNVEVLKNYTGINTLRELLESLKGKRWYVDIWGTWCGPCKQEFKHKKELSRLLKANDIETIYICEGNYSKEEVWKEMITYYDLEGKHLFANSKLVKDYIAKLSGDGSFTYPRYLLVNEQGEIVHKYAHKPSELLQLEKDIYKSFK